MTTIQKLTKILTGTAILTVSLSSSLNLQPLKNQSELLPKILEYQSAYAQVPMNFVPPAKKSPLRSQGSGSRGCNHYDLAEEDLVALIIPSKEYAAPIASKRPTFFWHLSKSISTPVKFTLTQKGVPQPIYEKTFDSPKAGMMQVTLPQDLPSTDENTRYIWSVTLVCNADRPSANPYYFSWVEFQNQTPELAQNLEKAENNLEKASVYAKEGLFYDSLAAISKAYPNDFYSTSEFQTLLQQVGLEEFAQK